MARSAHAVGNATKNEPAPAFDDGDPEVHRRQVTSEFSAGVVSNIRLSPWYLAYCCIFAVLSVVLIVTLLRVKTNPIKNTFSNN